MDEDYTEETTEETEAGTETGEEESAETSGEAEYELDDEGEPVLDDEGNPVPKKAEGEEEEKGKPDHKKNAQDRIQQLANEKRELAERLQRLESQFAKSQEEKPDFVEVDMDKVNAYIQNTSDKIEELKLEGQFLAAKKLENSITKLIADLEENDKKREAYLQRMAEGKTSENTFQERLKTLDEAAEFYRSNQKIEQAVWDKMGAWFAEQCQADPVLGREFAEQSERSAIGAIRWAHEYTSKNMGARERAAIETKKTNKDKAAAAAPTPGGKPSPVDLAKALEKAKELNTTQGWVEYQALKRKAQGR